jgi:hypothetical protein
MDDNFMNLLRTSTFTIIMMIVSVGCCKTNDLIREDYTAADRATYEVLAPNYLKYVEADPTLDSDEKKRRKRTVTTWRLRLEQAEKPVKTTSKEK